MDPSSQAAQLTPQDHLALAFQRMLDADSFLAAAQAHDQTAKLHLSRANIASSLTVMIPGQPLAIFFGGPWDGRVENLPGELAVKGYVVPLNTAGGEELYQTYEPAVIMMQGESPLSAIMVRASFAHNFKKRASSPVFNSEKGALIKLLTLTLGTDNVRYLSNALGKFIDIATRSPSGECCIIKIEGGE